ncbi:MAG TPA: hypothetical protein VM165_25235 [Planctomycetaceae bacterium]|nr:hypothetical protein [Planctomycetaceae bacterium]
MWGSDQARNAALWQSAVISGTARDDANTNFTHVLRPGLIMGKLDSGGEYEEWDGDVATGTQNIAGVLDTELRTLDFDAANADRVFRLLVARAPLKSRKLLIQGAAFIGHVDEYLARMQLHQAGFVLDDDPCGYLSGLVDRYALVTGTTDTLTEAENGTTLFYNNAASVTVTLPAAKPGLRYELCRAADEEFVFVSPTADNVIVGNDLSADGVTATTASEQIGVRWRLRSVYVGTTVKWLVEGPLCPFATGLNTPTYAINT